MKTILITGRNGFVGNVLAVRLKEKHRVISLVRSIKYGLDYSGEKLIVADNRTVKKDDIKEPRIGLIIHLAAAIRGNSQYLLENNVKSSENIFRLAGAFNAPVIYLSSTNALFSEVLGAYAVSKKRGEELLQESSVNYFILRVPLVVGRDSPSLNTVKDFYQKFKFFPLLGGQKGMVQPVHISSLVDKILSKVDNGVNSREILNIVGYRSYSYRAIIAAILSRNKKSNFITVPFFLSKLIAELFEKINAPFFVSLEELKSVNMDKIVKAGMPGEIEYVNNDEQALFS